MYQSSELNIPEQTENLSNITESSQNPNTDFNDEISNLLTQVFTFRERINITEIYNIEDFINKWLFTSRTVVFSTILLILLISGIIVDVKYITQNQEFSIKTLESEDIWLTYILLFFAISIFSWNLFLIFFKIFCSSNTGSSSDKFQFKLLSELMPVDLFYFNPGYFIVFFYYLDKTCMTTTFDFFCISIISVNFSVNFFFTYYSFNVFRAKISALIHENRILLYKIRIFIAFLLLMNGLNCYSINILTKFSDFHFIYFIQFKTFYLAIKQLALLYESEINYKSTVDGSLSTDENFYLLYQFRKTVLKSIIVFSISMIMIDSAAVFMRGTAYIFMWICVWCTSETSLIFIKILSIYDGVTTFFEKYNTIFPEVNLFKLRADKVDCIICTEELTFARRLSCGHYFHLICLSKWIEKGKLNCPMCRKVIVENLNISTDYYNENNDENNIINSSIYTINTNICYYLIRWICHSLFTSLNIDRNVGY